MSQLNSLNQSQQVQTANTGSDLVASKNNKVQAELSINNSLQGVFRLQGSATPITQQLTIAQANQLAQQPLLAILKQESALVFLQSQQNSTTLSLPPALLTMAQQWLRLDTTLANKLPKELVVFLASKLGLNTEQVQNQLLSAHLKQSTLQLFFLQGESIAEIKLGVAATQQASEQLEQLLHLMLPINMDDDASVLLQQHQPAHNLDGDDTLRFGLQFDLDDLGKLEVKIELKEFALSTVCICDSVKLQQKVEKHWSELADRLNSLGFELSNQIKQKTRLDSETSSKPSSSLINIKV